MRAPPVRSYIHMADPSVRDSFFGMTPPLPVRIGSRNGRILTRCGALCRRRWRSCECLVHEPDLALLQVAQAAVDELGGLRRRARGEVVALDERRAKAAGGGVEGDADAGDAAADHQDVERVVGESAQGGGPIEPARADHESAPAFTARSYGGARRATPGVLNRRGRARSATVCGAGHGIATG